MGKMIIKNLNLEKMLLGGQAFNWELINNSYYGWFREKVVKLEYDGSVLKWHFCPHEDELREKEFILKYLNLEVDASHLQASHFDDVHLMSAIKKYGKLHIMRQDFEDALLSFIISQNNNLKKIRTTLKKIAESYSDSIVVDGISFRLMPHLSKLTNLELLSQAGTGYRASYIAEIAPKLELIKETFDEPYIKRRQHLLQFKGIGDKVADCILVYGAGVNEITPIDRWAIRFLEKFYGLSPNAKYREMSDFMTTKFGQETAIAGQYLFEYIRELKN